MWNLQNSVSEIPHLRNANKLKSNIEFQKQKLLNGKEKIKMNINLNKFEKK